MPLQGNLVDTSATQVLNLISLARKTGMLTIHQDEANTLLASRPKQFQTQAKLTFVKGKLTWAALSNQRNDIVSLLAKYNRLSQERAAKIRERMGKSTDKALAVYVINGGFTTKKDIAASLNDHAEDVIQNVMTWSRGRFLFEDEVEPPRESILLAIDLSTIIAEEGREIRETQIIRAAIPQLDLVLKLAPKAKDELAQAELTKGDWQIISVVNGKNTIRDVAKHNNLSEVEVRKAVYKLAKQGFLRLEQPEVEPEPTRTQTLSRVTQAMRIFNPNNRK